MVIDYRQILPNLPLIHPEKAVSSVCSAKCEDVLGVELVQMKPLFSPALCRAWQVSGIPSTALPLLSTSWPLFSLFIARVNPAWHPVYPKPGNFRKLSCPPLRCLAEDPQAACSPQSIWSFRRARLDLHLPLAISRGVVVPGVQRTSARYSLAVQEPDTIISGHFLQPTNDL